MKTKRMIMLLLVLVLCVSITACGGGNSGSEKSGDANAQIAMVFGSGHADAVNDKAFLQDCWTGIKEFADANSKSYAYYQPIDDSKQSFLDTYDTAIKNGAEIIITVGNEPSDSIAEATFDNLDVKWLSIDATVDYDVSENHYAVALDASHAGWLAGVSAVREGFKSLGILPCVAIPPVDMWTWGYVQGANYAAGKYGIEGITLQHHYLNIWQASPEIQAVAASWYNSGVEVIQCNTAGGNTSIIAASDAAGAAVYGSDKDQYEEGDTVVCSEVVFRRPVVVDTLEKFFNGNFPGGQNVLLGIEVDAAGLVMEPNRFNNYTQAMYDEDYSDYKNDVGGIRTNTITIYDIPDVNEMWAAVKDKHIEFIDIE